METAKRCKTSDNHFFNKVYSEEYMKEQEGILCNQNGEMVKIALDYFVNSGQRKEWDDI